MSRKRVSVQRIADKQKEAEAKLVKTAEVKTDDSFVNFEHNLGISANNALSTATYGFNPITRQRTLLEWIYRGSWLGGVAVDVKADDMTRCGVEILGELPPDQVQAMEEESIQLGIFEKLNEALKWGYLYGGALAVILIDGQDNETPLRLSTIRKEQFKGLLVLDRWMVDPSLYDLITDYGPNLGLPKYYRVTAMAPALVNQKIHYSRVLRFEGVKLPYYQRLMENLWGLSVLERMYDRMIAFDSATTGASQLVYKAYIRNYKIKGLRQVVAAGGDALAGLSKYVDMMRRFQGIEGMTLLDSEDEFSSDSHTAFGGLSDILSRFMEQCAGALQIPLVRLFGQSPAGFSTGDTDLRNYYDTVKQSQERDLKVDITKVYRIMAASLGFQLPDGFSLEFRSLWQLTDSEKSDIASKNIDTISKAEESGLIDRATALRELKQQSKVTGMFTNITGEQIIEAENEPPPQPDAEEEEPAPPSFPSKE
jgi:phage-related protein (TIGR01555 family)